MITILFYSCFGLSAIMPNLLCLYFWEFKPID